MSGNDLYAFDYDSFICGGGLDPDFRFRILRVEFQQVGFELLGQVCGRDCRGFSGGYFDPGSIFGQTLAEISTENGAERSSSLVTIYPELSLELMRRPCGELY